MAVFIIGVFQANQELKIDGYPMFSVYQGTAENQQFIKKNLKHYTPVAMLRVECDDVMRALDHAYMSTQHIDGDWREDRADKGFMMIYRGKVRSTSVGDVITVYGEQDEQYVVASFGFDKI